MVLREQPEMVLPTLKQALHGAKQIIKSQLGLNQSTPDVAKARLRECGKCPYASKPMKVMFNPIEGVKTIRQCVRCSCIIEEKVKSADETCPEKKWKE